MEFEFVTVHTPLPPGMWFPSMLTGLGISSTAKIICCLLLDTVLKEGVLDKDGILFVHYPVAKLARDISRCSMTVKRALDELGDAGLIARIRQGVGKPNRIYVLIPKSGCEYVSEMPDRQRKYGRAENRY